MKKLLSMLMVMLMVAMLIPASMAEGETTVVTLALCHSPNVHDLMYDSAIFKSLKDQFGIEVQYQYYDEDQFALLLASGELPDIMTVHSQYLTTSIDNGLALELTPYLEQYPNLDNSIFHTSNELSRQLMGGEEHGLYFLCPQVGATAVGGKDSNVWGIRVRWDYYKEIGCPEIKNEDDYIQAMKDMIALHPTNEAGEKTYGVGITNDLYSWCNEGEALLDGGAVSPWTFSGTLYMPSWEDSTLYNGYTDEEHSAFWTSMRFYNKCWREGILDPDSFTMTWDEMEAKYNAQRYVGSVIYTGTGMYAEAAKEDPDTLAGIITIPSEAAFVWANQLSLTGNSPSCSIYVNAKSKNIDAALTVLNYMRDPESLMIYFNGEKGVAWDYDENGKPYLTDMAVESYTKNGRLGEQYIKDTGAGYADLTEFVPVTNGMLNEKGYNYCITESTEYREALLNPLQKDFANYYGFKTPGEVYMSYVKEGKSIDLSGFYGGTVGCGCTEVPTDIRRIADECYNLCERALPDLVMAKDDEEFAAAKAELMSKLEDADEATAWAWFEENYNSVKEVIQPICEAEIAAFRELYMK